MDDSKPHSSPQMVLTGIMFYFTGALEMGTFGIAVGSLIEYSDQYAEIFIV